MISIQNTDFINDIKAQYYNIIPNKLLLSLKKCFTKKECKTLIKISEDIGYKKASLYTDSGGKEHFYEDYRKSERCIIDDEKYAKILEKRIYDYIPKVYANKRYDSINPRFRFLKYENQGCFSRHRDSNYQTDSTISSITILIYLNSDYEGGYTKFFSNPTDNVEYTLNPKSGMVCLMDQDIGHEVPFLTSGVKYVVRTELMYKKEIINETTDNNNIKIIKL